MPSPSDFRRAFGLGQGEALGEHWLITSSKVGHDVIEQNERYDLPTELTLEWQAGDGGTQEGRGRGKKAIANRRRRALAAAFKRCTKEPRIVYSAYGIPYECKYVGSPSVTALTGGGETEEGAGAGAGGAPTPFRLTCLGRAARRRDIPTRQQAAQAERASKGQHDLSKDEERRCLACYRVIKSRFGSSRCALCGEVIDPGVKIAKKQGAGGRGGWAHATCVVAHVQRGGGEEEEAEEEEEEAEGPSSQEQEAKGGEEEAEGSEGQEKRAAGRGKQEAASKGRRQAGGRGKRRRSAAGDTEESGKGGKAEIGGPASRTRGRGRQRGRAEE